LEVLFIDSVSHDDGGCKKKKIKLGRKSEKGKMELISFCIQIGSGDFFFFFLRTLISATKGLPFSYPQCVTFAFGQTAALMGSPHES
jgi:hypothetical protein